MERSRLRGLKKAGDYVEVTFSPDDDYLACVYKAVDVLGWKYDPSDGVPYLCRLNGCRIVNQSLATGSWTIGAYVKSVFKSTNNIKLGVALLEVSYQRFYSYCKLDYGCVY